MLKRVEIPSPNHSSRGGSSVRLVVVHTAEGARTYQDLGRFFQNPAAQVSSHVGIDDTLGTIGEYVQRSEKAWTVAAYNPVSVNAETVGFASWSTDEWHKHDNMLQNTAMWIREECAHFGLPIVKLTALQAQTHGRGVCGHVELGLSGGGHHDPGPGFPWDYVLHLAAHQPTKENAVAIAAAELQGTPHVFVEAQDGSVWYTFQPHGGNAWNGGQQGQHIAGLKPFAPAPGK